MKVALCLSGQMRTYKEVYEDLKKNVLEPLDPDIFIHTWSNSGVVTKASFRRKDKITEEAIKYSTLEEMYQPRKVKIEVFKEKYFYEKNRVRVPEKLRQATPHYKGSIPMFYKIKKCNDLKKSYEKENDFYYDIVIRLRPDLVVKEQIPKKVLNNSDILWHKRAEDLDFKVSDCFAVSNSSNMDYYSSVWDNLSKYWENPLGNGNVKKYRVGERLMHHHMRKSSISTKAFNVKYYILRQPEAVSKLERISTKLKSTNFYQNYKNSFLMRLLKKIKNFFKEL